MSAAHDTATVDAAIVNEHRRFPRYDIKLPVSVRLKDGIHYNGITGNVSGNGIYFEHTSEEITVKDASCILTLYVEREDYSEEIKIKGIFKPREVGGAGVEFKTMSEQDFLSFLFLLSSEVPDSKKLYAELKDHHGVELFDD